MRPGRRAHRLAAPTAGVKSARRRSRACASPRGRRYRGGLGLLVVRGARHRATAELGLRALLAARLAPCSSSLDLQTGGGETYARALTDAGRPPGVVGATESWPPNVTVAARTLAPFGALVVEVAEDGDLPFVEASFDWSAAGTRPAAAGTSWRACSRPGGIFLSQGRGLRLEPGAVRGAGPAAAGPARRSGSSGGASRRPGRHRRAAGGHPRRVLRHRGRRALPAEGGLDRAGLHGPRYRRELADLHRQILAEAPVRVPLPAATSSPPAAGNSLRR